MDPVLKLWLYYNWLGDQRDDAELAKNHAYLLGSFSNPEAVKQMMNDNVHESTNEEFEESLRMVKENSTSLIEAMRPPTAPRRRRATLKE